MITPARGTGSTHLETDVDIATIKSKSIGELHEMAEGLNISNYSGLRKQDLIYRIEQNLLDSEVVLRGEGVLEGRVRRMDDDGLLGLLETLAARQEARIVEGEPWTMAKVPEAKLRKLLPGIVGFELEVQAWRPTFKLSQNKPAEERARLADGLEAQGSRALAELMRTLAT